MLRLVLLFLAILHATDAILVFDAKSKEARWTTWPEEGDAARESGRGRAGATLEATEAGYARVTLQDADASLTACHDGCVVPPTLRVLEDGMRDRPVAYRMRSVGGLYECPCISERTRHRFDKLVVEHVLGKFGTEGGGGEAGAGEEKGGGRGGGAGGRRRGRGLNYCSLGSGGLFSDLVLLCGLVRSGVRLSRVMLCDSIFQEITCGHEGEFEVR
mmetsp:Transcript_15131/g.51049  ORF Transcript_15131/g.51049 Transcript_15131/m.51049 type:complete len:216 (+) Transcript_15131:233-880(+)